MNPMRLAINGNIEGALIPGNEIGVAVELPAQNDRNELSRRFRNWRLGQVKRDRNYQGGVHCCGQLRHHSFRATASTKLQSRGTSLRLDAPEVARPGPSDKRHAIDVRLTNPHLPAFRNINIDSDGTEDISRLGRNWKLHLSLSGQHVGIEGVALRER